MNREDFNMLQENNLIYFDNGATTLKPNSVVNSIVDYYTKYCANAHRGDYKNTMLVDNLYEEEEKKLKHLSTLKIKVKLFLLVEQLMD